MQLSKMTTTLKFERNSKKFKTRDTFFFFFVDEFDNIFLDKRTTSHRIINQQNLIWKKELEKKRMKKENEFCRFD